MMVVPTADRVEPVPDRIVFGMVLFLASEVMFFGALFGAYFFLRVQTAVWPPRDITLDAVEPALATVLLVASSGTMVLAERAADRGDARRTTALIGVTAVLGLLFVASQIRGWLVDDFGISTNAYGTMFYAMTGFHALHVTAGLVLMVSTLPVALSAIRSGGSLGQLRATAYYWHFVDVVWVALFATLFVLR
jgi:cytochrome c oxidase subunit 3